jgi:hypothetical protein
VVLSSKSIIRKTSSRTMMPHCVRKPLRLHLMKFESKLVNKWMLKSKP